VSSAWRGPATASHVLGMETVDSRRAHAARLLNPSRPLSELVSAHHPRGGLLAELGLAALRLGGGGRVQVVDNPGHGTGHGTCQSDLMSEHRECGRQGALLHRFCVALRRLRQGSGERNRGAVLRGRGGAGGRMDRAGPASGQQAASRQSGWDPSWRPSARAAPARGLIRFAMHHGCVGSATRPRHPATRPRLPCSRFIQAHVISAHRFWHGGFRDGVRNGSAIHVPAPSRHVDFGTGGSRDAPGPTIGHPQPAPPPAVGICQCRGQAASLNSRPRTSSILFYSIQHHHPALRDVS
jgi:hypothetical protein